MTEELDELSTAIYFQVVPRAWIETSYPSKLSLSSWLLDLGMRISSIRHWVDRGPPSVFNIASFFRPQRFFESILRTIAREIHVCSSKLTVEFTILCRAAVHRAELP